jgi:hypothetical protein
MKKQILFITAILIFSAIAAYSQGENKPILDIHGFVKTDIIYDTRQTSSLREGHFHILPLDQSFDAEGNDINANPSFNILSIQTRLNGKITGPEISGIKSSGFIEGEFFGTSDGDVNGFRLRHAYVDLNWTNTQLRVGQFWHPLFITDCFPDVVNFNTGAPFQPFSRNPQIRLTHKIGSISLLAAAISQRDFQSNGPLWDANKQIYTSFASSVYQRNAVIPEMLFQARYNDDNFIFGASGSYKILRPQLTTNKNNSNGKPYANENTIGSYTAEAFMKYQSNPIKIKLECIYGQNLANLTMLGGYGAKSYNDSTGVMEYSNSNILSAWADFNYQVSENVSLNIFGGYSKNLGFDDNLVKIGSNFAVFSRAPEADNIIRISPYIRWNIGMVQIAAELEYTSVAYSTGAPDYAEKGKISETHNVSNIRTLLAVYMNF